MSIKFRFYKRKKFGPFFISASNSGGVKYGLKFGPFTWYWK